MLGKARLIKCDYLICYSMCADRLESMRGNCQRWNQLHHSVAMESMRGNWDQRRQLKAMGYAGNYGKNNCAILNGPTLCCMIDAALDCSIANH